MEDRIAAAAVISLVIVGVIGWIVIQKMAKRRRFKERQSGRGKNTASKSFEPAE
jgi:hypothetical protein